MLFQDREAWLTEATNLILDDLLMPLAEAYAEKMGREYVRPDIRISIGFPKHSRGGKAIAVCFVKEASTDSVNEIFINPEIDDPIEILEANIHEAIHAIDNCASGHRNFFAHMARKCGLEGPLTKTFAGDKLRATLKEYAGLLGEFPHSKMLMDKAHKKDSVRQRKVVCTNDDSRCKFIFRTSQKHIDSMRHDAECPACGTGFLRAV